MSVLCRVEMVPSHATPKEWDKGITFSRVPCMEELLFTDDCVFRVIRVYHPMTPYDKPLIRVVSS